MCRRGREGPPRRAGASTAEGCSTRSSDTTRGARAMLEGGGRREREMDHHGTPPTNDGSARPQPRGGCRIRPSASAWR